MKQLLQIYGRLSDHIQRQYPLFALSFRSVVIASVVLAVGLVIAFVVALHLERLQDFRTFAQGAVILALLVGLVVAQFSRIRPPSGAEEWSRVGEAWGALNFWGTFVAIGVLLSLYWLLKTFEIL